jgi:choline-sulfatase
MICTDHWPGALLGRAGHPVIQTPTLDQLADAGTRFTRAYTECPVCIPARRTLMTGTTPRTHGDRVYSATMRMPEVPTLAQCFREAGYQAYAVGKMHVYPQRDRVGFDDVILAEEGRLQYRVIDDYQTWLGERGYPGREFAHGMCNNDYISRPWHLPEDAHVTNWATREMCRMIRRRDPTRPGLFYLSYCHPHPPLVPLQAYLDLYRDVEIDSPCQGDWTDDDTHAIARRHNQDGRYNEDMIRAARRAFYALCTHIDHQLRLVIGTLREQHMLGNTIILFTSDHGDMLGNHGMWAKRVFYENAANVPMILVGAGSELGHHVEDDRLVGLADVMPTLLELAGIDVPETVEGRSMVSGDRREWLYGEINTDHDASRMVTDDRYKLIWYPVGNRVQLFDIQSDPRELRDLADTGEHAQTVDRLSKILAEQLYGEDQAWVTDGRLTGAPNVPAEPGTNKRLSGQRGLHWPPPMTGRSFEDTQS